MNSHCASSLYIYTCVLSECSIGVEIPVFQSSDSSKLQKYNRGKLPSTSLGMVQPHCLCECDTELSDPSSFFFVITEATCCRLEQLATSRISPESNRLESLALSLWNWPASPLPLCIPSLFWETSCACCSAFACQPSFHPVICKCSLTLM